MLSYPNIVETFLKTVKLLESKKISLGEKLDRFILASSLSDLAYVDGRKTAKDLGFDVWGELKRVYTSEERLKQKLGLKNLYSDSQAFPDFMFKSRVSDGGLVGGEVLELKDAQGSSIASFNSTIPSEYKTLKEIERLNGQKGKIVVKIAELFDENSGNKAWMTYKRKCFYMIRTHKGHPDKTRISIVDGAFFETLPERKLVAAMFQNIFEKHAEEYDIPENIRKNAKDVFQYLTDHALISFSQDIGGASIKPRLRIMAEATKEGNPHWREYGIPEKTFNLIIKADDESKIVENILKKRKVPVQTRKIKHRNGGEFIVFSYRAG